MNLVDVQGYANTYDIRFAVKPRQPIIGQRAVTSATTLWTYDLMTPYGLGASVMSNAGNTSQYMVAWGMIVRMAILAPGNATLTIQVDLTGGGTFTEIDTSPVAIALSAKVQVVTIPVMPCCFVRGRLVGDGSSYTYHVSCTDY